MLAIDPKVDYAFKHLFGRDANRPILIDLIDSVLDAGPEHRIREMPYYPMPNYSYGWQLQMSPYWYGR